MAFALKFRGGDRLKPDSIAGPDREVTGFGINNLKWCRPQKVPAAGRLDGIDGQVCRPAMATEPAGTRTRGDDPAERSRPGQGEDSRRKGNPGRKPDREYVVLDLTSECSSITSAGCKASLAATSSRSTPSYNTGMTTRLPCRTRVPPRWRRSWRSRVSRSTSSAFSGSAKTPTAR